MGVEIGGFLVFWVVEVRGLVGFFEVLFMITVFEVETEVIGILVDGFFETVVFDSLVVGSFDILVLLTVFEVLVVTFFEVVIGTLVVGFFEIVVGLLPLDRVVNDDIVKCDVDAGLADDVCGGA